MPQAAVKTETITITGTVIRRIFYNAENGYCVLAVKVANTPENNAGINPDLADPFADDYKVTGHMSSVREGDEYRFTGTWTSHPRFGPQFKFQEAELLLPSGKSGIARYLSGITAGVGAAKAQKIVDILGEDALDKIRENPDVLNSPRLSFLTELQREEIAADLSQNSVQAELAGMICGPGIGMGTVMRIMKEFGADAVAKVKENPYILCDEVWGVGFKTADAIALRTGIEPASPFRVEAALDWTIQEAGSEGHCYLEPRDVVPRLVGRKGIIAGSGVDIRDIALANQRLIDSGKCIREGDCVYTARLHRAEVAVAYAVRAMLEQEPREIQSLDAMIADIESRDGVEYAPEQKEGIASALTSPVSIMTGGPGTGKTTAINAIVDIYTRLHPENYLYLCAPTGRAAKRMSEATRHEAMTIHRLLHYNPIYNAFEYGPHEPLPGPGLLIVDESSMMDIELAACLLNAVQSCGREAHQVVLVGDVDQLPSVGPGSVLRDLIASGRVPTTRLKFNYRQAGGSKIAEFAHLVCRGEMPPLQSQGDYEFVAVENADQAAEIIVWLVQTLVQLEGRGPLQWQVLLPMHRGSCGVKALNEQLRELLNPARGEGDEGRKAELGGFRAGDKVMVIKNNYRLGVFNGDLGIVEAVGKGSLSVNFGDFGVEFPVETLDILTLAYASTIHKAQGSEFPLVFMALTGQHHIMLQRNLLYTGMTRAKKRLVLVGDELSIRKAVRNSKIEERFSKLAERVREKTLA